MVFTLAEKTGYSIEYILWEIPISVLGQAIHYMLFSSGAKTRRVSFVAGDEKDDIAKLIGLT